MRLSTPARQEWDVVGVVYPEETGYREVGDSWVVLARRVSHGAKGKRRLSDPRLVRAWRAGQDDLASRVPELRPLRSKTVVVVGTGGLGAPVSLELARAGVGELRLVEPDVVDPATAPRWPAGVASAGVPKLAVLVNYIGREYPYTSVEPSAWRVGLPRLDADQPSELDLLMRLLNGADLVVDSTAETGVQYALSTLCREFDVDYVCASATEGGWGGLVARLTGAACWSCLMTHLSAGGIRLPPASPAGTVLPAGCGDSTFTAAGFDLLPIAVATVRLAAATLSRGADDAYPDFDWDVARLALRDDGGNPVAPTWETYPLDPHPDCPSPNLHR